MIKKSTSPEVVESNPSRVAFESAAERNRINVERSSHLPDRYKYEHAEQMWKFWQDAEAAALSRAAQQAGGSTVQLVTLSSTLQALDHLDRSNSAGRREDAVLMLEHAVQGGPVAEVGYMKGHYEDGLQATIVDMARASDGMKLYPAPVVRPGSYKPE